MKLLLVEDDENKSREVEALVAARVDVTEVRLARSLHGGRKALRAETFDVVLLDMTLPNYDASADEPGGGSVHSFGGERLLRYMRRLELETPVVVVTQFELFMGVEGPMDIQQLDRRLANAFGELYLGIVYYHASLSRWQIDLGEFLDRVSDAVENGSDG